MRTGKWYGAEQAAALLFHYLNSRFSTLALTIAHSTHPEAAPLEVRKLDTPNSAFRPRIQTRTGMSEPSSESSGGYYINDTPSPATLRNLLFLDGQRSPSHDDTSLRVKSDIPSRSTWSDKSSDFVDPFLFTSTPELFFAASSSPYLSPAKECPFPHPSCTRLPGASSIHLVDPASDHASFVRHLDVLLQKVVEQQYVSKISSNARIYPEDVLDQKPQIVSSACDTSCDLESIVVSKARCSRSFPLLHRDWRQPSPSSGDPGGCVLSVTSHDASYVPTPNKRKALATIQEDFNIAVHLPTNAGCLLRRSDSYLSASDRPSPLTRRCSDTGCPRLKKQKCRSIDGTQPPAIVLLPQLGKSSTLSKKNAFQQKSSSFPRWREHGSNIDRVSTRLIGATASILPVDSGPTGPADHHTALYLAQLPCRTRFSIPTYSTSNTRS